MVALGRGGVSPRGREQIRGSIRGRSLDIGVNTHRPRGEENYPMACPSPAPTTAPPVVPPAASTSPVVGRSTLHFPSSPGSSSDLDSLSEGEDDIEIEPQLPVYSPLPVSPKSHITGSTEALSPPPPSSPENNTASSTDEEYYTASEYFRTSDSEDDSDDFFADVVVDADPAPTPIVDAAPTSTADAASAPAADAAPAPTADAALVPTVNAHAAGNIETNVVTPIVQSAQPMVSSRPVTPLTSRRQLTRNAATQAQMAADTPRRSERLRKWSSAMAVALAPVIVPDPIPARRSTRVQQALVSKGKPTHATRARPSLVPKMTRPAAAAAAAVAPETKTRQSARLKEKALK
ncbi:hypothetical protein BGZ95_008691 [Linnemannia exigua]|uniref:Uncharacterized protein n=1 Tax=Linnemannia exigua TaxID=604196 RepID=A0AAD4HAL4_9FUNG|nr:hypothetical protein BGZ95_008691 [Linnemannia exigua]